MGNYRLDKSISKIQTFAEAEKTNLFEKNVPLSERLNQGWYLSAIAYGVDPYNPPKMIKKFMGSRKHLV